MNEDGSGGEKKEGGRGRWKEAEEKKRIEIGEQKRKRAKSRTAIEG